MDNKNNSKIRFLEINISNNSVFNFSNLIMINDTENENDTMIGYHDFTINSTDYIIYNGNTIPIQITKEDLTIIISNKTEFNKDIKIIPLKIKNREGINNTVNINQINYLFKDYFEIKINQDGIFTTFSDIDKNYTNHNFIPLKTKQIIIDNYEISEKEFNLINFTNYSIQFNTKDQILLIKFKNSNISIKINHCFFDNNVNFVT